MDQKPIRRVISLWFPSFPTDRLQNAPAPPAVSNGTQLLATVRETAHGHRLAAVSQHAQEAGLRPDMTLSDARSLVPGLVTAPEAPEDDAKALINLARWAQRYSPWTAPDGTDGLWLDITGCAHLFRTETALLDDLTATLRRAGYMVRAALADTPGAAWALARYGGGTHTLVPPHGTQTALTPLGIRALRLDSETAENLDRLGLRRIGDLLGLPRASLALRFGDEVADALDRALGHTGETISPLEPPPQFRVHLRFAEPIGKPEDLEAALERLIAALMTRLAAQNQGVRRLTYRLFRVDGTVVEAAIGTNRPVRDSVHLMRLFQEKLGHLDSGFGVETALLNASAVELLPPSQSPLDPVSEDGPQTAENFDRLLDRLGNRLGPRGLATLAPEESHLPERAQRPAAPEKAGKRASISAAPACGTAAPLAPRPLHLLPVPEPIDVIAPVPDGPPVLFHWRRRAYKVDGAEGPERIAPEWWRSLLEAQRGATGPETETRDYYRVSDPSGAWFWVYRAGFYRPDKPRRWYLHGVF